MLICRNAEGVHGQKGWEPLVYIIIIVIDQ